MTDQRELDTELTGDPMTVIAGALDQLETQSDARRTVLAALSEIAQAADRNAPVRGATMLAGLVEILESSSESDAHGAESQQLSDIAAFIRTGVAILFDSVGSVPGADEQVDAIVQEAHQRWGEWLELVGTPVDVTVFDEASWCQNEETSLDEEDVQVPSAEELSLLLSSLGTSAADSNLPQPRHEETVESTTTGTPQQEAEPFSVSHAEHFPVAPGEITAPESLEGELLEAYLDDAGRCLGMIETSVLASTGAPGERQLLVQVCRELHTLKGASASVGLQEIATYLHDVEEYIQARCERDEVQFESERLLAMVDTVRSRIAGLQPGVEATERSSADETSPIPPPRDTGSLTHDSEETVRVKASQLDRLMDMLAELVMLRNGRESRIAELKAMNDELIRCGTRLRSDGDAGRHADQHRAEGNPIREVANDVLEIARSQRELFERASSENLAVSRFIRNFRQELTEVRRLPISGLFRRLQRAVHDAARTEQKKVRLQLIGGHAGLERSLQERLYEPLLHIVRNSVSHGIETESQRVAAGKEPEGTVTLEAKGAPNLLRLEVRDDGRGLDYDAIRRRGIERGILPADQPATRQELAQLVFHPGFSTRDAANAVSGRGVGMDVVADTLTRMGAWVEVESAPGSGTTIRLSIPLRSVIEHTMVFRCGGQLFAVPTQFVKGASQEADDGQDSSAGSIPTVGLRDLMGNTPPAASALSQRLTIGCRQAVSGDSELPAGAEPELQAVLLVDEVVGPEEVVVRPLPPLLRQQSLVTGVTLSGTGELLLLLDSRHLMEMACLPIGQPVRAADDHDATRTNDAHRNEVLIVDDSISARRCLARALKNLGVETVEASDGREALGLLKQRHFAAIFSDLEMPRMGGLDLLREVRGPKVERPVPVAIVSSRDEQEFQDQAAGLGAVAYLTKPVTEGQVGDVLKQFGLV